MFGKPHRLTYEYAHELLAEQMPRPNASASASVWMVGDNTESDIAGANGFGWKSALVRTGVYRDAHGTPNHTPTVLVDHVEDAVKSAIQHEWGVHVE